MNEATPALVFTGHYSDPRGWFMEAWQDGVKGWPWKPKQVNVSFSQKGVVRGLHYRVKLPEAKLVYCVSGEIEDIVVCLECGEKHLNVLKPNGYGLAVPPGWAHGFRAKEDSVVVYMVSEVYDPHDAWGINPMDKSLDCPWAYSDGLILSDQDKKWPDFDER